MRHIGIGANEREAFVTVFFSKFERSFEHRIGLHRIISFEYQQSGIIGIGSCHKLFIIFRHRAHGACEDFLVDRFGIKPIITAEISGVRPLLQLEKRHACCSGMHVVSVFF